MITHTWSSSYMGGRYRNINSRHSWRFPPGPGMHPSRSEPTNAVSSGSGHDRMHSSRSETTNNKQHTFKHCARSARQQQREHSAPHSKHKHKKGQKRAATGSDPRMSRLVTSSFNVPPKSNLRVGTVTARCHATVHFQGTTRKCSPEVAL